MVLVVLRGVVLIGVGRRVVVVGTGVVVVVVVVGTRISGKPVILVNVSSHMAGMSNCCISLTVQVHRGINLAHCVRGYAVVRAQVSV